MKNINFIIIENERLAFEDSEIEVKQFMSRRLAFFGAKSIKFVRKEVLSEEIVLVANNIDYIAILDVMNPITDIDLIKYGKKQIEKNNEMVVKVEGAVPGTQFEYLLAPGINLIEEVRSIYFFSQNKYNNQFNLYKYKRLKMFLKLKKEIERMEELSIDDFISRLCEEKRFQRLVAFGENVGVEYYQSCPHCGGDLVSLPMSMSQPLCGYIPNSHALYHKCSKCDLVVLSPYVPYERNEAIYDKWDTQDFVISSNNPYYSGKTRCNSLNLIAKILPKETNSVDLGGGCGNFSKYLKTTFPNWNVTHSDFAIKQNVELENMGIKTKALNIMEDEIGVCEYDLITAWEVVEHVPYEKFDFLINRIYSALKPNGIFLFSTPNFDSPLCKMNDFYAICPPFHYLCFGEKWIRKYFQQKSEWKEISVVPCSDFLDDSDMWCDYAARTAPSFQLRATADVLKILLQNDENKKILLDNNFGTEMIVAIQK